MHLGNSEIISHLHFFSITTPRFEQLAGEIADVFKTSPETYKAIKTKFYYPLTKGNSGRKKVNAGGALYDKYGKLRCKLIKWKIIGKQEILQEGMLFHHLYFILNV